MQIGHNFKHLLIAIDQFFNVLIFMIVAPNKKAFCDESLSSHAFRIEMERGITWPRKLIDGLLWWDSDHCQESYLSEIERRQLPPSMREAEEEKQI